jgi:hypothetical protein
MVPEPVKNRTGYVVSPGQVGLTAAGDLSNYIRTIGYPPGNEKVDELKRSIGNNIKDITGGFPQ